MGSILIVWRWGSFCKKFGVKMTLKKFILILIAFIVSSLIVMIYFPTHSYLLFVVMISAAIIAEIGRLFFHREKSAGEVTKVSKVTKEEDSGEYHNDFSKVPAGIEEPGAPIPMPRGVVLGDPYRRFEENFKEDLERAGLTDVDTDEKAVEKEDKK
jgi:hypothetical protein